MLGGYPGCSPVRTALGFYASHSTNRGTIFRLSAAPPRTDAVAWIPGCSHGVARHRRAVAQANQRTGRRKGSGTWSTCRPDRGGASVAVRAQRRPHRAFHSPRSGLVVVTTNAGGED
ncbi:hypothetical protein HBB16_05160 [Pseudonocardia sp. MCCB 268]|nr:hypothetical protein [Pseudonocardia cytotoxica]